MNKSLQEIIRKFVKDRSEDSSGDLSGSEFTSLLLDVYDQRTGRIKPQDLVKSFQENRFVQPGGLDPLKTKELELQSLTFAKENGFQPLTLSPVAPLGSCSAIATVSQKKILSSIRGTEVVADATNVLALRIASDFKVRSRGKEVIKYSTVHRHVRAQAFDNPDYTAHFAVLCLASGALDQGNFDTEVSQLQEHIRIISNLLQNIVPSERIRLNFFSKERNEKLKTMLIDTIGKFTDVRVQFEDDFNNKYYQLVQFKIYIDINGVDVDFADGGLVDWTQNLLGNKKHRCIISGIGLELVQKLLL